MSNLHRCLATAVLLCALVVTSFAVGLGVGRYVVPAGTAESNIAQRPELGVLYEAWSLIEREFYTVEPLDSEAMVHGAIRGMVNALGDRYTTFFTAQQADLFRQDLEGSFAGIGVTVGTTADGDYRVVRPLAGTPAERGGLKAGDILVSVDGTALRGMDQAGAISLLRGKEGTQVSLVVRNASGEQRALVLVRETIEVPTVQSRMLDNRIGYVALAEFNSRATTELRAHLTALLAERPRALVLDLRGNPGGYLHVAVEVASEFIERGVVVIQRSKDGKEDRLSANGSGIATDIGLAVLVDGGSASASEIVAGAIQDYQRGTLVGQRTLGKGSVQLTERLSDQSAIQITIQRWYTPRGNAIHGTGLAPDVVAELSEDDITAGRDPQLDAAVAVLLAQLQP
jgi:carboxyl-terminal processing protease